MGNILFHGTGRDYHNLQLERYGVYRHEMGSRRIQLTLDAELALHYAKIAQNCWGDWPAILVVYRDRVEGLELLTGDTFLSCPELRSEWYDFVPAKVK